MWHQPCPWPHAARLYLRKGPHARSLLTWGHAVRYAPQLDKAGLLINMTTVLPPSGLVRGRLVSMRDQRNHLSTLQRPEDRRNGNTPHKCPSNKEMPLSPKDRCKLPSCFLLTLLVFLGIVLALHHWGFDSPMIYDSDAVINKQSDAFDRGDVGTVLRKVPWRPLFMLTLYANFVLDGTAPYLYRVFNALFLAAAGAVLVFMIRLALETTLTRQSESARERHLVSLFLGLLFVAHPLQTFVVLYVYQREAILACLFYFSAMAAYVAVRRGRVKHPTVGYGATSLLFLAGLLSKENTITLPITLALADLILFRCPMRTMVRRLLVVAAVCVPPAVVYLAVSHAIQGAESLYDPLELNRAINYYKIGGWKLTSSC